MFQTWLAVALCLASPAFAQIPDEPAPPITVTETIVVPGAPPAPRRESATLSTTLEARHIAGLPLNGRTFVTLAGTAPGVALPPGSQFPRINGGRPRTNEYLFDGISVLQPEPGQVAFFPVVDAIYDFTVITSSAPAEYGRFNGGVVVMRTRAGSDELHGTAFTFVRHERLGARNYFAPADSEKPAFRRNQYGGVIGGPILRRRTFFFADYQGQRQTIARTVISTVPTRLQRQGIFTEAIAGRAPAIYDPGSGDTIRAPFPGGVIPAERMDPVALALLQRYPLPTSDGTANNYLRTAPESDDQDQWTVRLDHRIAGGRDQLFGRLTNVRGTFLPVTPLPDGSGVTTGTLGPQQTVSWAFASSYQRALSAGMLNELRIGDTRRTVERTAVQPSFLISGYQQLGSPPNTLTDFDTSVTEIADTVTWLRGAHTIKAGFDWRWTRLDVVQPPSPGGAFTFNALGSDLPGTADTGTPFASFLLGQVQSFSIDIQRDPIQQRASMQEYFIQDEWRVTPRLTVSPGLRYTLNFPSREINGQTAVLNLETGLLEYPGDRPVRPLKKDNFGPRLGLVFRATERTIVSSGFGLVWIEMAGITTPFTTPSFPFLQTVTQRALDTLSPAFLLRNGPTVAAIEPTPTAGHGQGVFSVDRTLGSGYVQQWNAAVQRELTSTITVDVAYVGSKITRVGIPDTNLNQLTVDQLALGPALLQRLPNPYFGIIPRSSSLGDPTIPLAQLLKRYPQYTTVSLYRNNVGNTNYHGLTVTLERRLSRGLSFMASYTRSRLMDDASSVFDAAVLTGPVANYPAADSHDRRRERDVSTGDLPHVFVTSAVWDFKGWTTAALVTLQSGAPVAVTQTTNFNAFAGFGTQRPNLTGNPELPASERTPERWFDTTAFAIAPQFTLGSASRNPVRGPAYRNVDLAVSRLLPARGGLTVEMRGEVFNLLNTANFGNPNGVAGSAAFGSITTAADPRVVQLAAKVRF